MNDLPSSVASPASPYAKPKSKPRTERIHLLDVLRGFGVLGILLMNIIGFGLLSPAYSYPGFDVDPGGAANLWVWIAGELFAEGSMRGMFSLLFGAGVVLFTTGAGAKSATLHYKRMFYLLLFGLLDAYILLWFGDILVCYALCGAMLYPLRNWRARSLLFLSAVITVLMSLGYFALEFSLDQARISAELVANTVDPTTLNANILAGAEGWAKFSSDFKLSAESLALEQSLRTASYTSAFSWNLSQSNEMLLFVVPVFILWDALLMMLLGMAMFKLGALQGRLTSRSIWLLAVVGLSLGLAINAWEVASALSQGLSLMSVFAQANWTYHFGRGAMTLGYLGVLALIVQKAWCTGITRRLAAVGRMALSNYLMQSVMGMLLFTGAGLGLVGQLERAQLYLVVLGIWILQLWLSPLWLHRYRFGPVEYLWRWLTYGRQP